MIQVFCDNYLLNNDSITELVLFDMKVNRELNKVWTFRFTIYPNHPYFSQLKRLESVITVYEDGDILFRGRILNDELGFNNEKRVLCESDMAYLLDTIQHPYQFQGDIPDMFAMLINNHNTQSTPKQQFKVGNVTVTDPNDYLNRSNSDYSSTWEALTGKLVDSVGGYLQVRYEADGPYLDYLADLGTDLNHPIQYAENLLDIQRDIKGEDIVTAVIPLGATITDEETGEESRVTIVSVNGGLDYVQDNTLVSKYGFICKVVEWPDVTLPENLKTRALAYLAEYKNFIYTINVHAVDTGQRLGQKVKVVSSKHGIDEIFMIQKQELDLSNKANNRLTLGGTVKSFTEITKDEQQDIRDHVSSQINRKVSTVIQNISTEFSSAIQSSETAILSTVSENTYSRGETDTLLSTVSSSIKQTKDGIDIEFTNVKDDLSGFKEETNNQFEELFGHINIVDGDIRLSATGASVSLVLKYDRVYFESNGVELGYFKDNYLYVNDIEAINSLKIGYFAFLPRANGNLSLKKVR